MHSKISFHHLGFQYICSLQWIYQWYKTATHFPTCVAIDLNWVAFCSVIPATSNPDYNHHQIGRPVYIVNLYRQLQQAFTAFGPLLTKPLLHKHRTFDPCNQYVNCIMKKMYLVCYFYASSKWMDVNPQSWDTAVSLPGHCSNGVVELVYREACA